MYVKVCGITHLEDAESAVLAGVDALGFNFVPSSKRFVGREEARAIVGQVRGKVACVAVVAGLSLADCRELAASVGVDRIQLHGDEPPELVNALGAMAFKAVRIGTVEDVELAMTYPGDPLLVDAKVAGQLGGTGQLVDRSLIAPLVAARRTILAGGLTPENVGEAVASVQPWGVDAASGVERSHDPRRKDPEKVRRFVAAARRAASGARP